jgi:hypothetical protein
MFISPGFRNQLAVSLAVSESAFLFIAILDAAGARRRSKRRPGAPFIWQAQARKLTPDRRQCQRPGTHGRPMIPPELASSSRLGVAPNHPARIPSSFVCPGRRGLPQPDLAWANRTAAGTLRRRNPALCGRRKVSPWLPSNGEWSGTPRTAPSFCHRPTCAACHACRGCTTRHIRHGAGRGPRLSGIGAEPLGRQPLFVKVEPGPITASRRKIGRDRQGHNLVSAGAGRNLRVHDRGIIDV